MKIQFIDITSYRGISSNAEHYYATVASDTTGFQESLVTDTLCRPNSGVCYVNGEELRYFPSRNEAEALWEKDHGWEKDVPQVAKGKERNIAEIMEYGTIRFPSILSVIKQARKNYPDSVICFSFCKSVQEFVKRVLTLAQEDKTFDEEIDSFIKQAPATD